MIKWWRILDPEPKDGEPYIAMVKTYDIDNTICNCIKNAAPGMVAIVLSRLMGPASMAKCEAAAELRRQTHPEFHRIIWWWGPVTQSEFTTEALKRMRPYDFQS